MEQTPEFIEQAGKEFPTQVPLEDALSEASEDDLGVSANRRDFLKALGFGVTAATLSACVEAPTRYAIPYVNKPDDVIPGVANWYASTTPEGVPVLVKTRVGRPIKLEGNPDSPLTGGGLSAIGQASVLSLYDEDRLKGPMRNGNLSDWGTVDSEIVATLGRIAQAGGKIRLLSRSVLSPSTQAIINEFAAANGDVQHVMYDPVSSYAITRAHELSFGVKAIPNHRFDRAEVIVSFSADFLGTWLAPVQFSYQYSQMRDPEHKMSRHFQFESLLTITGSKADLRFPVKPSQEGIALLNLYNKVAKILGQGTLPDVPPFNVAMNAMDKAASELVAAQGKSLVVSGSNNIAVQQLVCAINQMLGNYGNTLELNNPMKTRQGDDEAFANLVGELEGGEVAALMFLDANPVYDTPYGEQIAQAIPNVELSVSFASKEDETSKLCGYTCPDHHYLEAWGDAQQDAMHYSLIQPMINPIYDTRQVQDSLLKWSGTNQSYEDYLKAYWENTVYPRTGVTDSFQRFWVEALRSGVVEMPEQAATPVNRFEADLLSINRSIKYQNEQTEPGEELILYEKVGIRDGKYANNPWLQEFPDPISRACWDNYLTVSKVYAEEKGLKMGDIVEVQAGEKKLQVPVLVQMGQANGTLGLALGYGRVEGGRVIARTGGVDAYPMLDFAFNSMQYAVSGVQVQKTTRTYKIAQVQTFHTLYDPAKGEMLGNDYDRSEQIVKETTYAYYHSEEEDNPYRKSLAKYQEKKKHLISLWDSYFEDPESQRTIHWTMAIDLNKCTGCGACVISCQAENNVPVVGKQEVLTRREMHWIRIDRYYSGDPENPDVVFQPMLCQHCDNAPCETVCPVLATIHSNEGLNQMTYNRCVGTRYCANNCPYKVRRFNWFNYPYNDKFKTINPAQNDLGRLVLNPDVTVRWRGVMEKCSFCVQRLQEAKLKAKVNAESTFAKPKDGEVQTACQQSCPTGAIVFGDRNDPNSAVYKAMTHERAYLALEEVKTLPSVNYMTLVRNRTVEESEAKTAERKAVQTYGAAKEA